MSERLAAFLRGTEIPELAERSAHPAQRPTWFFPGLASRPFPDASAAVTACTLRLEAAADDVRRELAALEREREPAVHRAEQLLVHEGAWREFRLFTRGAADEALVARCPITVDLVRSIPGATAAGLVYFSALRPHTRVALHCGPINTRWRCHLALDVPPRCELRVAGEPRRWRDGSCIVFDDSFAHEASNASDQTRTVLIVDLWHPGLTEAERAGVTAFFDRRAGRGPPLDAVGALGAFAAGGPAGAPRGR